MNENRKKWSPPKPRDPVEKKPAPWKEYLKARVMRSFPSDPDLLRSVIREKAYQKRNDDEKGLPKMNDQVTAVTPKTSEINQKARKLAKLLMQKDDREKPGKIRRMETAISRAGDRDSIHVQLCRFFPRVKKPTRQAIRQMVEILGKWDHRAFQRMFHMMRIYYEAFDAGFERKENENE